MRVLSCHIENYGNISDADFDFHPGITEFLEENGYGKTTLASFIKAMFYGLPISRKGSKFNDRRHFYPFHGGKFGGNLVFISGECEYRIERFFDSSSGAKDSLKVYCNGNLMEASGVEPGKSIFGLDAESFERTVFLTSGEIEISATGDLSAKLGSFVDDTDENHNFDTAVSVLDKARKELKAARGKNDLITRQRETINRLRSEINRLNGISEALGALYGQRETLYGEVKRLSKLEKDEGERKILLQKLETYDTYRDTQARETERMNQIARKYPGGFRHTEEELSEIENQIADARVLEMRIRELREREPSMRQQELIHKFRNHGPSGQEREGLAECVRQYQTKTEEQEAQAARIARNASERNASGALLVKLFLVIGFFLVVGGCLFLFSDALSGGILLGIGIFIFAIGIFLSLRIRLASSLGMRKEELRLQKETEDLRSEIRERLAAYEYCSQMGILYDYAAFVKDYEEYEAFCREWKEQERLFLEDERKLGKVMKATEQFFQAYGLGAGADKSAFLAQLRSDSAQYNHILKNVAYLEKAAFDYREKNNLPKRPEKSVSDMDFRPEELEEKRSALAALDRETADLERELESFEEKQKQLVSAEETLENYLEKYEIYTASIELLKLSEQNLRDRYVRPVKEQFLKYADVLEKTLGEKITMDKDFRIFYERGGENRTEKHLSAGQRSICQLCFRLALMEQMFEDEKPFLIMDDPFTGLDALHMSKAAKLLKELAKGRQVIYFSCHESRRLSDI